MRARIMTAVISFLCILILIIGFGCGDDTTKPDPGSSVPYIESDSTILLPIEEQNTILAYEAATGAMTLKESSEYTQGIEVGSILVGQDDEFAPDGFLRKVICITNDSGQMILDTEPALLAEAFQEMSISDTIQLRPSQIKTSKLHNGSTFVQDKDDETFRVTLNCVLYDLDGNQNTTYDQIKLHGEFNFTAALFADVEISLFTLNLLEVGIETDEQVELNVVGEVEWTFLDEQEFDLWDVRLGAIPIGSAVWVVPSIFIEAHVHGDMSVTFETGVSYAQEIRNGLGYQKSSSPQFYSISENSKVFTYAPPTFEAGFDFETGVSLNASCLLYGVAGPYMAGKTELRFESNLSADPCDLGLLFDLEAIFYAVVGLEMDAYVFDLDWSRDYELYRHPVGDWTFPLSGSGIIMIDSSPDSINAPWLLVGPCNYSESGNGDYTVSNLTSGDYTLTWNSVSGYTAPPAETKHLAVDDTVIFSGSYTEEALVGTVIIDQTPNSLSGAGWTLSGPQSRYGNGDITIPGLPVGDYTLAWNPVSGYTTPPAETKTLGSDGIVTFSGTYSESSDPSVGFVQISAGTFAMGSPTSEPQRGSNESHHIVTLTKSFEMFKTEVTNQQYANQAQWAYDRGYCTGSSSSLRDALDGSTVELIDLDDGDCEISFEDDTFTVDPGKSDHPVQEVNWYGAVAYCDWLSLRAGLTRAYDHSNWSFYDDNPYGSMSYRLPTEAEWEYACRAGTQTPFNTGNCLNAVTEANYNGSSPYPGCPNGPYLGRTVPVGSYSANAWGLHDMHGNLWEWCNDRYGSYSGDQTNPVGASSGLERVIRGGRWYVEARYCRSAYRGDHRSPDRSDAVGFRPVRSTN